jgi:hypothetical protein
MIMELTEDDPGAHEVILAVSVIEIVDTESAFAVY